MVKRRVNMSGEANEMNCKGFSLFQLSFFPSFFCFSWHSLLRARYSYQLFLPLFSYSPIRRLVYTLPQSVLESVNSPLTDLSFDSTLKDGL